MKALSETLDKVGRGDFSARAPQRGGDEIARIGQGVNEMLAQIDRLVINIRRVSTDVAHDLRTPLAHVRQQLEVVVQSDDPAAAHEGIRAAQAKVDDVLRIFSAILRLAEIDAGGARSRFTSINLAGVVERVTDAYRGDIEAAGRTLGVDISEGACVKIHGDADLIAQALANLIENAMRHTPPGTPIDVRLDNNGRTFALSVIDRGPGIPQADQQRVLEPFVRLDASRTTDGAGLGLSIVAAIARAHGASLRLENMNPGLATAIIWPTDVADRRA
jgi:signal transduction histidine kinase